MWDIARLQAIIGDMFDIVQIASLVVSVILAVSSVQWIKLNRGKWGYEVPVIVLAVTTFIFYLLIVMVKFEIIKHPPAQFLFSNWSTILRLQELLTMLFYVRLRIEISKDRENHEKVLSSGG